MFLACVRLGVSLSRHVGTELIALSRESCACSENRIRRQASVVTGSRRLKWSDRQMAKTTNGKAAVPIGWEDQNGNLAQSQVVSTARCCLRLSRSEPIGVAGKPHLYPPRRLPGRKRLGKVYRWCRRWLLLRQLNRMWARLSYANLGLMGSSRAFFSGCAAHLVGDGDGAGEARSRRSLSLTNASHANRIPRFATVSAAIAVTLQTIDDYTVMDCGSVPWTAGVSRVFVFVNPLAFFALPMHHRNSLSNASTIESTCSHAFAARSPFPVR